MLGCAQTEGRTQAVSSSVAPKARAAEFAECALCHGTAGEGTDAGPPLAGVLDHAPGTISDFPYSAALRRSSSVWTRERLAAFLLDPAQTIPGNRMGFAGAGSAERAAALVDYLATLE